VKEIGTGLLGFGTVGAGVVTALNRNGPMIARRLGVRPVLRRIADLDIARDRGVKVDPALLTRDAMAAVNDPQVQAVIELIGGTGEARRVICEALKRRKPVITANKALLAEHADEIFGLAREQETDLYFGASVGGGIPIIRSLRDGLIANRIEGLTGILNGTCNHILTRMDEAGLAFDEALREAQQAGFAEADPSLDIDGKDTAHKAVLLAWLAYGFHVPLRDICVQGIRNLAREDLQGARDLGFAIKLLALIRRDGPEVEVRVHPALVARGHMLASVGGVFNAVLVRGDFVGDSLYYGRGAGREPTASTVVADLCDAARNLAAGTTRGWPTPTPQEERQRLRPMAEVETRNYLRFSLNDKPGTLARVAAILGEHRISIASALQRESQDTLRVPCVMVTHRAAEGRVLDALARIDAMDFVGAPTVRLRILD
jgi:homoserine dehydrogenase